MDSGGSGWRIESVDHHYLNIVEYFPLSGEPYIKLPPELQKSAKGLINLKNDDNECFRWCRIRYLNPQQVLPKESGQQINHSLVC